MLALFDEDKGPCFGCGVVDATKESGSALMDKIRRRHNDEKH